MIRYPVVDIPFFRALVSRYLLLCRVVMLQWAGKVLKKGNLDDEWGGDLLVLTDRDIQLVEDPGVSGV